MEVKDKSFSLAKLKPMLILVRYLSNTFKG